MHFMAQSCLDVVINFLWPPEPDQNMLYLSHYHRSVPTSATFYNNAEILRKLTNSTVWLKIPHSAENGGPHK